MAAWAPRRWDRAALLAGCLAAASALACLLLPPTWAAALVAAGILALVIIVYPQAALVLLALCVPFGSLFDVRLGPMTVGLTEASVGLLLFGWLLRRLSGQRLTLAIPRFGLAVLLFLALNLISLLNARSLEHGIKELLKWMEVLVVYLFVVNELDERWRRVVLAALVGSAALAAVQGIAQFLRGVGPEGFILFDRFLRAYGTFQQPNPYGGYLGLSLPLALGLLATRLLPAGKRPSWRWAAFGGICGIPIGVALLMSWSRGAWLGAALASGAVGLVTLRRAATPRLLLPALGVAVALVAWGASSGRLRAALDLRFADLSLPSAGTDVRGAEITDANYAVLERAAHWQSALEMWTDRPWLGVGAGNYEPSYPEYALPMWPEALGHAHNYYLNVAAERGTLGLAAYLLLLVAAFGIAWRGTRQATGLEWGMAAGALGLMVHLSLHSVVDNLYVHGIYLQVAMALGLVSVPRTGLLSAFPDGAPARTAPAALQAAPGAGAASHG